MSDVAFADYSFVDSRDFVSKKESAKKSSLALKILMVVFVALLLIEGVVYFVVLPALSLPKISWVGLSSVSELEAFELLGEVRTQSWVEFDREKAVSKLLTAPYVEEVEITKTLPNKISVKVVERKPIAMAFITQGDKTETVQIDKKGVIFQQSEKTDSALPLISGIPIENIPEGMRIPEKFIPLMEQIDSIRALKQNYFAAVSEIHVVPKEYGNYELVLYPLHSRTRILTDRLLSEDSLKYMIVMLDVVNALEPNVTEIDLRYGAVSYRTK